MAAMLTQPATLSALVLATNSVSTLSTGPRPRASLDNRAVRRSPAPIHFSCGDYLKYEDE